MKRNLLIAICSAFLLSACGGDEPASTDKSSGMAGEKSASMSADTRANGKSADGIMIVDHSQDEIEFRLRRALGGVERMIAQYKEEGLDTAELKARKAELEKELKNLVGK